MDVNQDKYEGYSFTLNLTNSQLLKPRNETVEVRMTTKDGQEYSANFTARAFIDYMFEKNKRNGERLKGTYFCMPNMILVEELSEQNIRGLCKLVAENMMSKCLSIFLSWPISKRSTYTFTSQPLSLSSGKMQI